MNLNSCLLLFTSFALIAESFGHKNTLKNYLDGYKMTLTKMTYSESYLSAPNFPCVEEKLNMTNIGNKTLDVELAIAVLTFGLIICSDSYIENDIKKKFEGVEKFGAENPNVVRCMKWELEKTISSKSVLNLTDTEQLKCRNMKISKKISENFDSQFSFFKKSLSYVDCADYNSNKLITLKMYALTDEEDNKKKQSKLKNIVEDAVEQNEKIFNCLKNFIVNFKIKGKKH